MSSSAKFEIVSNPSSIRRREPGKLLQRAISVLSTCQTFILRTFLSKPRAMAKPGIQKILIIKLDELGDTMMAWPLIDGLRSNLPNAEITLAVNQVVAGIWHEVPGIRVFSVNVRGKRVFRPFLLPLRHFRFVRDQLRGEAFDICLIPRRDSDDVYATFLAYFSPSLRRISFTEKSTPRKAILNRTFDSLLTDVLPVPPVQHETISNLIMLAHLLPSATLYPKQFPVGMDATKFAAKELSVPQASCVALCPSSGHSGLKQWGAERFAQLANELISRGLTVVLVGAPSDTGLGGLIQSSCNGRCINLIGKTSLAEMAALLRRCAVFVGNDTGPMHVASALGIFTVGIFGSSCSHIFGPWAPRQSVLAKEIFCSPCHDHVRNRCDSCIHERTLCLDRISVQDVLGAITLGLDLETQTESS